MDKKVVKLVHAGDADQLDKTLQVIDKDEKSRLLSTIYTHGDSIAHFAAREHQLEILKVLARHQCPFEISNENGRQPLHEAIGSQPCIEFLVSECQVDVNAMKRGDWTAIMIAAMKGLTDTVKILLHYGARLDMVNRDGWNALHLAVKEEFNDLSTYLIDKYPEASLAVSKSGRLPVQTAARCNEDSYLTLYLLTHSPHGPKAILNYQDNSGQNLLQDAVAAKNNQLVRTLIQDYGADANVPDKLGRTAIHHAAMIGCIDIMVVLRDLERRHGTEIDWDRADSWDEWTPLMHAAREGHSETSKFLIEECGADCSKQDKQGRTPGDIAVEP
ncbi:hypothetical protein K450DRAFT_221731 [Umbelopsis ramanniana AG]|uniref:Uncharacterized protein n=1 Tax=Umbelopsis ramanniana AG TaxID=1314678 RepID=A0AAD5HID7_UMBRA|nr:uncharacterized protein K450DRAFT_221731 [Umbelopsis ramanniana AG]KAI8583561.1 hypothetical protein K450DRAFT_221731 [Umbelopsis ramanniana AG]